MDMMKTLTRLVSAFGPSGCERDISQVIEELAAPYADEISRETSSAAKRGAAPE